MMKIIIKYRLWIIRISVLIILPLSFLIILFYTNKSDLIKNKLLEINTATVSIFLILFILDIFKGWVSNNISDLIFPGEIKKIKKNVEEIKEYSSILKKTSSEIDKNTKKILELLSVNPRKIKKHLESLIQQQSFIKKKEQINKWYEDEVIKLEIREILLLFIHYQEKTVESIENELLKNKNSNDYKFLKIIKDSISNNESAKIKENYLMYKSEFKDKEILFLKTSINASKLILAYDETKFLYKELISIESNIDNHLEFSEFLGRYNDLNDAIIQSNIALEKLKKEEKNITRKALILNNLSTYYSKNKDIINENKTLQDAYDIIVKDVSENPNITNIFILIAIIGNRTKHLEVKQSITLLNEIVNSENKLFNNIHIIKPYFAQFSLAPNKVGVIF